jgi:hypothetical protein
MNDLLTKDDTLLMEMLELEAGCESTHRDAIAPECSGEVTHVSRTLCGGSRLICSNAARSTREAIGLGYWKCRKCKRSVADCWTVTPA